MTVCIQYAKPSSGQADGEVYGLDVAVHNFLTAWFRYGSQENFYCRPVDVESFEHFKQLARAAGVDADKRCVGLHPNYPKENLEKISCLFRPDPLIGDLIWKRRQLTGNGYAACGLVHTMSGERIARAVGDLMLSPSDGADALICPSAAVRDAVRNLWDIHARYYNHRFGGSFTCPVETPVIPLGIDTDKFMRITSPEKRLLQREALGADPDDIIVLFVGRLSFATKAHPLPLFLALERAAKLAKRKLRLVMLGYFKPKDMEPHFRNLAADILKTVPYDFVMNDDPRFPEGLWAAADIFTSLSDNVQESFGLTPIEAMAARLPTIVTDWDGYKDGVRDGLDGFRLATVTPPEAAGQVLAENYLNQNNYGVSLVAASQSTALDINRCAEALRILADDDEKRLGMGASGRARAQNTFDWSHIIKAYEKLWQELAKKRAASPASACVPVDWAAAHPAYPNPWRMFASFPSGQLAIEDRLHIAMSNEDIETILKHEMNYFVPDVLVHPNSMRALIESIRKAGSPRIIDVLEVFPKPEHARIFRCMGWMLKHGVAARGVKPT
jgi:glycosyltransferase involved in cell wall biosynthesis